MIIDDAKIAIVIPARLNSTRVKQKMLIEFDGEPLIRLVFDKCRTMGYDTYVVTDSKKIAQHITFDHVIMTGDCENGTERIASVLSKLRKYDVIINVQGDMLDININTLRPLIKECVHNDVTTCYTEGCKSDDVKVIHQEGRAMWFTRSDIGYGDRHLGLYAYKPHILGSYGLFIDNYPQENLEQNRILGHYDINVVKTEYNGIEINTKEDINSRTVLN
jgi:3-deoxy-manno-octulosonate cytidylyltransferase (CMP-KDO synthetase)|tara:strand:- start:29719 stop:30375 length:657 start_codon:yes stop_codon:yes gene_type:complete